MPSDEQYLADLRRSAEYDADAKRKFHIAAKFMLNRLAPWLDFQGVFGERDPIRVNKGGIAVSGEVTLHYDRLYIQVSQFAFGERDMGVLFRTCTSRKDYTGGQNNFATFPELVNTVQFGARIIRTCKPMVGA